MREETTGMMKLIQLYIKEAPCIRAPEAGDVLSLLMGPAKAHIRLGNRGREHGARLHREEGKFTTCPGC
jgi:hypothetical protein